MIYLDNAASSHPKPDAVVRAVARQLKHNGANPGRSGHQMAMKASNTVYSCRSALATFFGTEPETVFFTNNTTEAINRAIKGILRPGDHVLISDLEHNSVLRPLVSLRNHGIITFDVVKTGSTDEELLKNLRNATKTNTKLIFFTHASNVTGRILPIRSVGQFCKQQGILFGVDGAQTAGIEELNLSNHGIDLLCIPGHKGLLGPQGTGALLLATPLELTPLTEGGTGVNSLSEEQPFSLPDRYESGTLNTPGLAGLKAGIDYVQAHRNEIQHREQRLRSLFLREMKNVPEFRILNEGEQFVGTIAVVHQNDHSEKIAYWLNENKICVRGGFQCSALAHKTLNTTVGGVIRVSMGYRNTEKDVIDCVKCLKNYQKK
ncbi:MAG: aminotransferase class V-fold PLP-dependent enzyme [Clostridia bacterium]|nr:aminotransferase class V-fold PLP-dependent enzyme [Clostridia bacterium]